MPKNATMKFLSKDSVYAKNITLENEDMVIIIKLIKFEVTVRKINAKLKVVARNLDANNFVENTMILFQAEEIQ